MWKINTNVFVIFVITAVYLSIFFYISLLDNGIFSDYGYPIHNGGDSSEYAFLTKNLLESGSFSLDGSPEMFRTPGYSLFLAPFVVLDSSFLLAIAVQIALLIGSAILIRKIGEKFLPAPLPLLAALFFALDPATVFYTLGIWSEIPFVFLSLLSAYLLFVKESRGWADLALAGLALGFAALVRPAGEYMILLYAAVALFTYMKSAGFRIATTHAVLVLLVAAAVLLPWYVRNFDATGEIGLSTTGPYTFLFYHAKNFALKSGISGEEFDRNVYQRIGVAENRELRSIEYSDDMMGIVKETVLADPVRYGIYHALGSANLFLGSSIRDASINLPNVSAALSAIGLIGQNDINVKELFATDPLRAIWYSVSSEPLLTLERVFRLFTVVLFVLGMWNLFLENRVMGITVLSVLIVLYTAAAIGPVSYPRYRIPLEPFFYLIAAAGLLKLPWRIRGTSVKVPQ